MSLYSGVWLKIGHPHVPQKHLFNGVPLKVSESYILVTGIPPILISSTVDIVSIPHRLSIRPSRSEIRPWIPLSGDWRRLSSRGDSQPASQAWDWGRTDPAGYFAAVCAVADVPTASPREEFIVLHADFHRYIVRVAHQLARAFSFGDADIPLQRHSPSI